MRIERMESFEIVKNTIIDNLSGTIVPDFLLLENVNSTNDYLKNLCENKYSEIISTFGTDRIIEEGFSVIALSQSNGKGRSGRKFFSPPECSVYLSVLLRPDFPLEEVQIITPMAAVAVNEAIKDVCNKKSGIKWVNDIYIDNRKICGILTEASILSGETIPDYVIVGIGINVFWPKCEIPKEIENIYGTIFESGVLYDEEIIGKLAAKVILNLYSYYLDINNRSFVKLYNDSLFLIGRKVTYFDGNGEKTVLVEGIDRDVHLLVRDENGKLLVLKDGEVRLNGWEKS